MYVSFKGVCVWCVIGDSCGEDRDECVCVVGLLVLKCPSMRLSVCLSSIVVAVGVVDLVGVWMVLGVV